MGRKQTGSKPRREKVIIAGMANQSLIECLEDVADQLGVQVRHEKGDFHSAGCRVEEQDIIMLKKSDPDDMKAKILLDEIAKYNIQNIKIPPAVQKRLTLIREQLVEENSIV